MRRRHILPTTQWGHLATDGLVVAWDAAAAQRLSDLQWLRITVGATWPQLGDPVPPAQLLTNQPTDRWPAILRAWAAIQPWRTIPPLWSAGRTLTHPQPAADK
ncbi:hypothetical protein [Mycobacterium paragordonae]|nr:hypothetical protein [Mycobacterium paragordonae]